MPESIQRIYQSLAEGYRFHSTLGSYVPLHFLSCPRFTEAFVDRCEHSRNSL